MFLIHCCSKAKTVTEIKPQCLFLLESILFLKLFKDFFSCLIRIMCSTLGQRYSLEAQHWRPRWRRSARPPWPCPWCCGRWGEKWPRHCRTPVCWRSGIWLHWRCQAGSWPGKPRRKSPELWSPEIPGHSRRQWLSPCCTQWGAPCAQNECPSQGKGESFPAGSIDNHLDQGAHGNDS